MREGGALDVAVRAPEGEHEPEDLQRKRARVFRARAEEALEDHGLPGERPQRDSRRRRSATRAELAQQQELDSRRSDVRNAAGMVKVVQVKVFHFRCKDAFPGDRPCNRGTYTQWGTGTGALAKHLREWQRIYRSTQDGTRDFAASLKPGYLPPHRDTAIKMLTVIVELGDVYIFGECVSFQTDTVRKLLVQISISRREPLAQGLDVATEYRIENMRTHLRRHRLVCRRARTRRFCGRRPRRTSATRAPNRFQREFAMLYSAQKLRELEDLKARLKVYTLLKACSICGDKAKLICGPCRTTAYCSKDCLIIDWRDRGHRKACEKIRDERAADAARAESPTPPPSPPPEVFYGPAPRSDADAARARIAAEFEAARARREAEPEPEPVARDGPRCPVCYEEWDVNVEPKFRVCCCRKVCASCEERIGDGPCALCRAPLLDGAAQLAQLRRHVENDVPEAICCLGAAYHFGGKFDIVKSGKKAAKIYKRAVQLGNVDAMVNLGVLRATGDGVQMDRKKAMKLYRIASDRGNAAAQCGLGTMLREDRNFVEAFRCYKLAAEQTYTHAEHELGCCYFKGEGVEADFDEAKRCFARAATKGHELSKNTFRVLETHGPEKSRRILELALSYAR